MARDLTYEELEQKVEQLENKAVKCKEQEQASGEGKNRFRDFLDNLGDLAYETDCSGNVTYANKMGEIVTGLALKDIVGKPFLPLFTEESQEAAINVYQRTLHGESPEYDLTFTNGRICHFKNEPLRDKKGEIKGVFGIARDITAQRQAEQALKSACDELEKRVEERTTELAKANNQLKRKIEEHKKAEEALRESEEKYKDLAESISDTFFAMDRNLVYTYWNKASEELTGISAEDAIGKSLLEIFPDNEESRAALEVYKEVLRTQQLRVFVNEYHIGGKKYFFEISAYPSKDGLSVFVKDITERKQAEIALQEKEEMLERQAQHLEEVNTALKVLLDHREQEKKRLEENILANTRKLIIPYIEKLENSQLEHKIQTYLSIIKSNLEDLISPFATTLSSRYLAFTPTEIQISNLIKEGKTSKEIANLLNVSPKAVAFHRSNIRRKLGLVNKKVNLRAYLQSLIS